MQSSRDRFAPSIIAPDEGERNNDDFDEHAERRA
jgi:hypothetical protein